MERCIVVDWSAEELAALKGQGFLLAKDKEHFVCRIVFIAGVITAEELAKVSEIAKTYGDGTVITTVRLNLELPNIPPENVEPMKKALEEAGLSYGGTGAKMRPLVCCKGTVCKFGLLDTQALCKKLAERFYPAPLPHKFKINITGCPNNCAKVQLNDIGLMGAPKNKLRVFIGGVFGRNHIMGDEICRIDVDKAERAVELCLDFFKKFGAPKQRFGVLLMEMKETDEYFTLVSDLKALEE